MDETDVRGWDSLPPEDKIEAFKHLTKRDIGKGPGKWNKEAFASRLSQTGLRTNKEVVNYLVSQGLLPKSAYIK